MLLYSQFSAICGLVGAARAANVAPLVKGASPADIRAAKEIHDLTRFIGSLPRFH
jgi:hypothetical protein